MKTKSTLIISILSFSIILAACSSDPAVDEPTGEPPEVCILPPEMTIGERAKYSFSSKDIDEYKFALELVDESEDAFTLIERSGEIVRLVTLSKTCNDTISGRERSKKDGVLSDEVSATKPPSEHELSLEAQFILFGAVWPEDGARIASSRRNDASLPQDPDEPVEDDIECKDGEVEVPAGKFKVEICEYELTLDEGVVRRIRTYMQAPKSETGKPTPYRGRGGR